MRILSLRAADARDWFGPPFISVLCDVPAAGRYAVSIEAVEGPAQGRVRLSLDEIPAGEAVDLYAPARRKAGPIRMGILHLAEGPNPLHFALVGKNPASAGLGLDLVRIICEKVKE